MARCAKCKEFILRKSYFGEVVVCRRCKRLWTEIHAKNTVSGANFYNSYLDKRGYLRWNDGNKLVHRDVAFKHCEWDGPFRDKDVHHRDKNKTNNEPANLVVLTRQQHSIYHGQIISNGGRDYHRFARVSKIYRQTTKAIMVARVWIPRSQIIIRGEYVYATLWILREKGLRTG